MGSSQSALPEPVVREKLVERLRAMEIKHEQDPEKGEYVFVDEHERGPIYTPRQTNVSIRDAEQWERELLADPKVRTDIHPFDVANLMPTEPPRPLCPLL